MASDGEKYYSMSKDRHVRGKGQTCYHCPEQRHATTVHYHCPEQKTDMLPLSRAKDRHATTVQTDMLPLSRAKTCYHCPDRHATTVQTDMLPLSRAKTCYHCPDRHATTVQSHCPEPLSRAKDRHATTVQSKDMLPLFRQTCYHCPEQKTDMLPLSRAKDRHATTVQTDMLPLSRAKDRHATTVQSKRQTCYHCPEQRHATTVQTDMLPLSRAKDRHATTVQSKGQIHSAAPSAWSTYYIYKKGLIEHWDSCSLFPAQCTPFLRPTRCEDPHTHIHIPLHCTSLPHYSITMVTAPQLIPNLIRATNNDISKMLNLITRKHSTVPWQYHDKKWWTIMTS